MSIELTVLQMPFCGFTSRVGRRNVETGAHRGAQAGGTFIKWMHVLQIQGRLSFN
jgi:hypothetical protein